VQAPVAETERRLGLQPGDLADMQEMPVWPENWPAAELSDALQTQWTVAPSGRLVGLRYESLPVVCRALRIRRRKQRRLFRDLRVMEYAVLEALGTDAAPPGEAALPDEQTDDWPR